MNTGRVNSFSEDYFRGILSIPGRLAGENDALENVKRPLWNA